MRITDVKVTVWEWKDIPPTRYTLRVKSSGSKSVEMGLVRIITDEGIEGHAFLGNALATLGNDGRMVIDRFKPMLVGKDPLAREQIWQAMTGWAMGLCVSSAPSMWRCGIWPVRRLECLFIV